MFETTVDNLSTHLSEDMGIENEDLVFLFSGIFGLGKLSEGLLTIESIRKCSFKRYCHSSHLQL